PQPLHFELIRLHLTSPREGLLGIRSKGSDHLAQYVGMHATYQRCLRDRDTTLLHQPHSLKLELSCIAFAFHRPPPAPESHLTRCPRTRVQARPPLGRAS